MNNREIDAMVATHVFGEPIPLTEPDGIDGTPIGIWVPIDVYGEPSAWDCPKFSTYPAASKQLRDKMRTDGWGYMIRVEDDINCSFWKSYVINVGVNADTEELAVALAALKAVGVEVDRP